MPAGNSDCIAPTAGEVTMLSTLSEAATEEFAAPVESVLI